MANSYVTIFGCRRAALLKLEEEYIERQCAEIAKHKPDLVITEKGLSDLAMHFLTKAGISAIRRLRKTDNNRIARATGATIVHRHPPPPPFKTSAIHTLPLKHPRVTVLCSWNVINCSEKQILGATTHG